MRLWAFGFFSAAENAKVAPVLAETPVMLSWLSSRLKPISDAPGHPLGSDDSIAAWLSELPVVNPQRVLLAIDEWLQDPEHLAKNLDSAQMARAISRLDDYAQPAVAHCWQELFREARSEQRGALPARALETYYAHSHASNLMVLQRLVTHSELSQEKRLLAKFAARAMRAWVSLKKLAHMNYRSPPDDWWGEAHALNRRARDLAISHIEQHLYRDDPAQSSLWKEYMAGLLLDTLPLTNLTANEIEAAARLAAWIEPRCQYLETQTGLSLFSIDPLGTRGPERCPEDAAAPQPSLRYLGPGAGYQQLLQLSQTLRAAHSLPTWLESIGLSVEDVNNLLQTMIVHWSPNPPRRGQPRHARSGTILVVHGLAMARRMIAASEFARSGRTLDYEGFIKSMRLHHQRDDVLIQDVPSAPKTPLEVLQLLESAGDRQMMDQWEARDESVRGMGALCMTRRSWHTIGALVAYRQEQELDWRVGIVRRLGSSRGVPNAGLATFHGVPRCSQARISQGSGGEDAWQGQVQEVSGIGWRDAILLSEEDQLLLVPNGTFRADQRIDISVGGRFRTVVMLAVQARGNDYELVRYSDAGGQQSA